MWHCTGLMSHLDNFVPPIVQLSAINGGAARLHSDAGLKDCREPPTQKGCAVCFIHSDSHVSRRQFIEQFSLGRSEEHTSELQSLAYLVCRLLLEKKKQSR